MFKSLNKPKYSLLSHFNFQIDRFFELKKSEDWIGCHFFDGASKLHQFRHSTSPYFLPRLLFDEPLRMAVVLHLALDCISDLLSEILLVEPNSSQASPNELGMVLL